jgi:hypothetical protein
MARDEQDAREARRDVAWELRQRLYELVEWFRADLNRLNQAQDQLRDPRAWAAEVGEEAKALNLHGPPRLAPDELAPIDALRALEATDLAAHLAGAVWLTRPQRCGAGDRARYVVRRVRSVRPLSGRQSGYVSAHLRHHVLVPVTITVPSGATFTVRIEPMRSGIERADVVATLRSLVIGTTSFEDGGAIEWCDTSGAALNVAGAEARGDRLVEVLREAAVHRVDVLVAPELTVPPALRDVVFEALARVPQKVALAVLGSFHELRADPGHPPRNFNVAQLVDGWGNLLFEHRKLVRFGTLDVPDQPPEKIHVGHELRLLLTPFGTVAVAICRDFCDDRMGIVWQELQPDLLLVPAYGRGGSAHVRAAREAARTSGTVTVLAHEALGSVPDRSESFVHDALQPDEISTHQVAPAFKAHNVPLTFEDQELDPETGSN